MESVPLPFSTVWTPEVYLLSVLANTLILSKIESVGHFTQQHGGEVHVSPGGRALLYWAHCLCHRNSHQGKALFLFLFLYLRYKIC